MFQYKFYKIPESNDPQNSLVPVQGPSNTGVYEYVKL